jgi:hypothetical protein
MLVAGRGLSLYLFTRGGWSSRPPVARSADYPQVPLTVPVCG